MSFVKHQPKEHNRVEPTGRFELPASGLRNRCSTTELRRRGDEAYQGSTGPPRRPLQESADRSDLPVDRAVGATADSIERHDLDLDLTSSLLHSPSPGDPAVHADDWPDPATAPVVDPGLRRGVAEVLAQAIAEQVR